MISEKEAKKLKLMLTLIPLIPAFILFKHSQIKASIIIITVFWSISLLTIISKNMANFVHTYGKKLLKIIGDFLAVAALFVIYIFAVVPTGLVMKITKRDRLKLKKQNFETYWQDIKQEEQNHEYQF